MASSHTGGQGQCRAAQAQQPHGGQHQTVRCAGTPQPENSA